MKIVSTLAEVNNVIKDHELETTTKFRSIKSVNLFGKESIIGRPYMFKRGRRRIQETKKKNCPAKTSIPHIIKFPDFKLRQSESAESSKRNEKDQISTHIKMAIGKKEPITFLHQYLISFPSDEEHKNHFKGEARALKVSPGPSQATTGPVPNPPGKQKPTSVDAKAAQQTDEILNSILPPREWTEGGQLWVQQVSSTPATRLDVVNLQEELDRRLQQRQARETGICPVRRELYSQCFDELIRQVTINCAERGLLLLRVRDEIRMTIAAYQTLYESSVAFGMRKALQAEQGKADMEKKISELEQEKRDLERQVNELKGKCEQIEKRAQEQRQVEEKKHTEEMQFLKRTNQQLKTQLEGIIAPKK